MQEIITKIVENEDTLKPVLFKHAQFEVLRKLDNNKPLSENEKRYLRGNIRNKIEAIAKLTENKENELSGLLNSIGSYYITGFEALKLNGYGWYYTSKKIDVINTKIEGKIRMAGKTIAFIRIKSISKSRFNKINNINYATNEQIYKDNKIIKNAYLQKAWIQMINRYPKLFVKNIKKYKDLIKTSTIDLNSYGV